MLIYGQLSLETSGLINCIAVSSVPKNSANENEVSAFRARCANNIITILCCESFIFNFSDSCILHTKHRNMYITYK